MINKLQLGIPKHLVARPTKEGWDIEKHILVGRSFTHERFLLPQAFCPMDHLEFLTDLEHQLINRIHTNRYLRMRQISKTIQMAIAGNESTRENHRSLFSNMEGSVASLLPEPVLKSYEDIHLSILTLVPHLDRWSALALLAHQSFTTQAHFKLSLKKSHPYSPILKDLFFYHWKEDAQQAKSHCAAIKNEHEQLGFPIPYSAVDGFLEVLHLLESFTEEAAADDTEYFLKIRNPALSDENLSKLQNTWMQNYRRWEIEGAFTMTRFFGLIDGQLNRKQMAELVSFTSQMKKPNPIRSGFLVI